MTIRPLILATFLTVLIGSVIGGGTLLGRSLSASPPTSPRLQVVDGEFPMTFQGILLEDDGSPVSNSSHSLTFSLYNDPTASGPLWSETQTVFTFEGLFTTYLGVEDDIDSSIFANNSQTYMGIRVGFNPEMTPRIRMSYSPYALHAVTADNTLTPPVNPYRVATLLWYNGRVAEQKVGVGEAPTDIAFDGEHLWIANRGDEDETDDDVVTKVRALTGKKVADFPVGTNPVAVAFDGDNIWAANRDGNNITRFRTDGTKRLTFDGKDLGKGKAGVSRPTDLAFDGEFMWVVSQGTDEVITFATNSVDSTMAISVGNNPAAIAFDGENMWVTHSGTRNVTKIRASDGEIIEIIAAGGGQKGIAFDGTNMWVINEGKDDVTKVRASDGEVLDTFSVGLEPIAVAFDGESIWVVNNDSNDVTKLRTTDGEVIGTYKVGRSPSSIAFDGINMWVVSQDDNNVMKK